MTLFVSDPDFDLHVGDVRDVLATLPSGSVDCCVTSPPYWGLRDYGSGRWEGGDPDHSHDTAPARGGRGGSGSPGKQTEGAFPSRLALPQCSCGAVYLDQQIGLEQTPGEYVEQIVAVFREVRRVLADHGTVWLNLGDSYANDTKWGGSTGGKHVEGLHGGTGVGRQKVTTGLKAKDLVGVPWRVAFALQDDGWYLRSDIIWSKPNVMPESVTDRPTKSHEYVFMLSKQPRYFFDQEAVREPHSPDGRSVTTVVGGDGSIQHRDGERWPNGGRNIRSVWEIVTASYSEAHFATFPEALPERCIKAGCPEFVCGTCGKPRERIVEREGESTEQRMARSTKAMPGHEIAPRSDGGLTQHAAGSLLSAPRPARMIGWTDCGHDDWRPGVVLDPFMGSGTTALVARKLGRRSVGVELNPEYAKLCAGRLQQLSLFA